jgi:hypothetical protein
MACSRKVLHDSSDGSETSGSLRVVDSTMISNSPLDLQKVI